MSKKTASYLLTTSIGDNVKKKKGLATKFSMIQIRQTSKNNDNNNKTKKTKRCANLGKEIGLISIKRGC